MILANDTKIEDGGRLLGDPTETALIQYALPADPRIWWSVAAVIIIGTLIPFQLATNSLKYIKATTFSLMDAFEPITATLGSVLFFGVIMKPMDWLGSVLIILATLALSIPLPAFFKKTL